MPDETSPPTASATPFQLLGGEAGVRALVDAFYDRMDLEVAFAGIRNLHHDTLDASRDKLAWFLTGWLGGPQRYVERFGHPMLRARHLPFAIGDAQRDQWMACMAQALQECGVEPDLATGLRQAFQGTADWMRNRAS